MTDKRDTAGFSQGERIDDAPYTPPAETGRKTYWCCSADFGEHETTCANFATAKPSCEVAPVSPPQDEEFQNPTRQVMFRAGLLACREYMARFVEPQNPAIAESIRANWWPSLGDDPGKPRQLRFDEVTDGGENGPWPMKEISPSLEALPVALAFLIQSSEVAPVSPPKCSADLGEIGRCSRPKGHEGTCMIGWGESPVSPEPALRVVKYVDCDCAEEYSHHCPQCGGTGRKAVMVAFNPADSASPCQHYVLGGECQKCGGIFREAGTVGAKPEPQFPIGNTAMITRIAKEWSKDDRLWTTQETVAFNLATFARAILFAHATVQPRDCPIPGEVAPVSPPRITESYVEQLRFERDLLQGAQDRYMNLMYALADEECDIEKLRAEVRQTLGEK